jgi:hypothetical protein
MAVVLKRSQERRRPSAGTDTVRIGRIVSVDPEGRPLVTFEGAAGPTIARVGTGEPGPSEDELRASPAVVLMFEGGDPDQPIVTGFVRPGFARRSLPETVLAAGRNQPITLNGKVLVFEGQEEIVLKCGLGSLTIRADGHIVVKGTRLVSRATETNKIRGATVQIN